MGAMHICTLMGQAAHRSLGIAKEVGNLQSNFHKIRKKDEYEEFRESLN